MTEVELGAPALGGPAWLQRWERASAASAASPRRHDLLQLPSGPADEWKTSATLEPLPCLEVSAELLCCGRGWEGVRGRGWGAESATWSAKMKVLGNNGGSEVDRVGVTPRGARVASPGVSRARNSRGEKRAYITR